MPRSARYFFAASESAHDQFTSIFDFVSPTLAAAWNLRWQVRGFLETNPTASTETLEKRFVLGSGVHGVNIRRACVDFTWEQQQEQMAAFVLVNALAIYDDYANQIGLLAKASKEKIAKQLRFPTSANGKKGWGWAISEFASSPSNGLRGAFQIGCRSKPTYSRCLIENLLRCYRYFAEIRNCNMHGGGICNKAAEDAYKEFSAVASIADLGLNEVPHHDLLTRGARCRLKLRGVIGLCDVILRMIATTDAELCECENAERPFILRAKSNAQPGRMLPADQTRKDARISLLLLRCNLPKPVVTANLITMLADNNIISRI